MSRASSVEEIRERLEALGGSGRDWRPSDDFDGEVVAGDDAVTVVRTDPGVGARREEHVLRFIAHAPQDIAYLLEIAEAARDYLEAKYACDKRENCWPDNTPYDEVRRKYHEAEDRLRDALEAENE